MLIAPDNAIALGSALVAVLLGVQSFRAGAEPRLTAIAVAWLVVASLFGVRPIIQGIGNAAPGENLRPLLTVVSWNAQGIPPEDMMDRLIDVIRDRNVDVVVLPETGDVVGGRAAAHLVKMGWDNVYFGPEATSVIMRSDLAKDANYRLVQGNPPWAGITVAPETPSRTTPVIVATHIQQPSPGNLQVRADHLNWVEQICAESQYVLAIGDFNSTLNHLTHATLGKCKDVAVEHGAGAASTWPTWLPTWLGISIDRALVGPPYDPAASTFEILRDIDISGVEGWATGRQTGHWPIAITIEDSR